MKLKYAPFFCILMGLLHSSCGFKVSSSGDSLLASVNIISGIVTPLVGSITRDNSHNIFLANAYGGICTSPIYAKIYKIENDGSILESFPLASYQLGGDARYSFDANVLNLSHLNDNVEYIVKVDGCDGDIYQRPITNIDSRQDLNAKTTVVAEVVNSNTLVSRQLNQVKRADVDSLINTISGGTSITTAFNSLKNDTVPSAKFQEIFGSTPDVISEAKPSVSLNAPTSVINELAASQFNVGTFHVDPNYSFAYKWKLDGAVKSSAATWNYIPGANESGTHQVDVYVGKNDGTGNIDLTKPFYTKTISINVNNNIVPTPPAFTLNVANPTPVNTNTVQLDLATGVALSNCSSFSHLAITDSNTIPGIMQFSIDCHASGTQTESVTFASGDGTKTLYLWAIDNEGVVSSPKSISLILDSLPPTGSVAVATNNIKGGAAYSVAISADDGGVGVQSVDLFVTYDGGSTYSLLSHINPTATAYSWNVPSSDTINAKLKLIVRDFTGAASTFYSQVFGIDSTDPTVSISTPSGIVKGSSSLAVNFSSSDSSGIASQQLFYAVDGVSFGSPITISPGATTYSFTMPANNTSSAKFKLVSIDSVGNSREMTTNAFSVDSIAPAASVVTPSGVVQGGVNKLISLSASDANGLSSLKISYAADGSHFGTPISLTTSAANYNFPIPSDDVAAAKIKIEAIDNAGNVSTALTDAFVVDSAAPVLTLSTPGYALSGGSSFTLNYSATDAGTVSSLQLAYAADGVTFGAPTNLTIGSTSVSWIVPSSDTLLAKLKLSATDAAGNTASITSNAFTVDSTNPNAPVVARASSTASSSRTVTINTTCNADYDKILYSESSATPAANSGSWEACAGTKSFTVSTGDGVKTVYAFTKDVAGNISASSNITMTLDTNPPAAPAASLASAAISGTTITAFTIVDCLDRPHILVSESMIAPAASDSGWGACSTSAGAITYTLIGPVLQGSHALYVYAKDAVGNVSASTSASMIYDTVNPTLNFSTTLGSLYKGGDIIALNFGASDTNGLSTFKLEYSTDGTNYSLARALAATDTTYNWTVPASNTTTAKARLVAIDNATPANTTTVYSGTFSVDSTLPTAPTLARTSSAITSSTAVTMTVGSCTDTASILISESNIRPSEGAAGWQLCSTAASYYTQTVSGEGTHTLYAWAKDGAGNIATTANSVTMILDTSVPVIAVTTPSSMQGNVSTGSVSWTLTETNVAASTNFLVEIFDGSSWTSIGTKAANTGANTSQSYTLSNFSVPNVNTMVAKIRVTLADAAGNSTTTTTSNFMIDSAAPTVNSFLLAGGATSTTSNFSSVNLQIADNVAAKYFCMKYNVNTRPLTSDSCWIPVSSSLAGSLTPAPSLTITSYFFQLGLSAGTYNVYTWVKDDVGNISNLTNSGAGTAGVDSATITYLPPSAPIIKTVVAIATDFPEIEPPGAEDLTIPSGHDVYIRWAASGSLGSTPISIAYKMTSGSSWTTVATGLANGKNGNCTVNDSNTSIVETGCYLWSGGSPSNGTYQIQVTATDQNSTSTVASTALINGGQIQMLAGNTSTGAEGSAKTATYFSTGSGDNSYVNQFVVAPNGYIFIYDSRGIFRIKPSDGVSHLLIPITGTNNITSAGVASTSATLDNIHGLALDFNQNVLIRTSSRIIRFPSNIDNPTVKTIIGGGASTADGAAPLSYSLGGSGGSYMLLTPLPNGNIYFDSNYVTSYYDAQDGLIHNLARPSGTGLSGWPAVEMSNCTGSGVGVDYGLVVDISSSTITDIIARLGGSGTRCGTAISNNPGLRIKPATNTLASYPSGSLNSGWGFVQACKTGMDGVLYCMNAKSGKLVKYNPTTNAMTSVTSSGKVIGNQTAGYCPDGTLVNECPMFPQSFFITQDSKMYILDNSTIRTVLSDGTIYTLYGAFGAVGDGGPALAASLIGTSSIQRSSDGKIQLLQSSFNVIREINTAGNINRIAGNYVAGSQSLAVGNNALTSPLNGTVSWGFPSTIYTPPGSSSNIYMGDTQRVYLLDRASGSWSSIVGGGATSNYSTAAEGTAGANISFTVSGGYNIFGFGDDVYVANNSNLSSSNNPQVIMQYDAENSYTQHLTTGSPAGTGSACSVGNSATGCIYPATITSLGLPVFDNTGSRMFITKGGTSNSIWVLQGGSYVTSYSTTSIPYVMAYRKNASAQDIIYYCNGTAIYEKNIQAGTDAVLPNWPSGLNCQSSSNSGARNMIYDADDNRIIFLLKLNGLTGIGTYNLTN